jgi:DNA/RNA endonuclease G (NUC1)
MRQTLLRLSAVPALLLVGACSDRSPLAVYPNPTSPPLPSTALVCEAEVRTGSVRCGGGEGVLSDGARADVSIFGGQGVNVVLASSNVAYDSATETFGFDVTIQNLMPEALGTLDGLTLDSAGIRVFLAEEPAATSGSGEITVGGDGTGFFTAANQPYFEYPIRLDSGQVSAPKRWEFEVPATVGAFRFRVYVRAQAQALLVVNEIMVNPAGAVQDSSGEYVELYNRGRLAVNLNGFYMRDNGTRADTIKSDLVAPAGGYLLLARSGNTAKNGGIVPDYVYTGQIGGTSTNLTFSNSGADRFVLSAPTGVTVDSVAYTSASIAGRSGIARELADPRLDNSAVDGANWRDATNVYDVANNNRGTPRASNDSTSSGSPGAGTAATVGVTPASVTLAPGASRQFTATPRDSAGTPTSAALTWVVLDSAVARVNGSGLVTAQADGATLLIVSIPSGAADTAAVTVSTPSTSAVYRNHLEFGTPTFGAADSGVIVVNKAQFVSGYSPMRGGPAWVSWNLNSTHFGAADRCDCFSPDGQLPDSVYKVVTGDYTGSGYSRGHMVMSEQRTTTDAENAVTFLMTNILPQLQGMNGGPWLQFEILSNDSARAGREVYNVAGGIYGASPATLNGAGIVQIPTSTWKVIVIMPGGQGLADVTSASDIRVLAVDMVQSATGAWQSYQTTVDALEAATGLDLLAALPDHIEVVVEGS